MAVAAIVAGLGWGWLTADAGPQLTRLADGEATPPEAAADGAARHGPQRTVSERARVTAALSAGGDVGRVAVVADGRERHVAAVEDTVAGLLARLEIDLDDDDRVDPGRGHRLADGDRVVVERVERLRREREVAIAADEREEPTGALQRGERRVVQDGRPGLVVITEAITRVDGETVDRTEIGRATARAPRDTVIEVGTADPAPEPARVASQPTTAGAPQPSSGAASGHDHAEDTGHDHAGQAEPADGGHGDPADPATWDRLAECESGGNWQANTGNGYYGGLQFHPDTWRAVGGTGKPHEHPRETQIEMGRRLHARDGWSPWPHCSRELGYR